MISFFFSLYNTVTNLFLHYTILPQTSASTTLTESMKSFGIMAFTVFATLVAALPTSLETRDCIPDAHVCSADMSGCCPGYVCKEVDTPSNPVFSCLPA